MTLLPTFGLPTRRMDGRASRAAVVAGGDSAARSGSARERESAIATNPRALRLSVFGAGRAAAEDGQAMALGREDRARRTPPPAASRSPGRRTRPPGRSRCTPCDRDARAPGSARKRMCRSPKRRPDRRRRTGRAGGGSGRRSPATRDGGARGARDRASRHRSARPSRARRTGWRDAPGSCATPGSPGTGGSGPLPCGARPPWRRRAPRLSGRSSMPPSMALSMPSPFSLSCLAFFPLPCRERSPGAVAGLPIGPESSCYYD